MMRLMSVIVVLLLAASPVLAADCGAMQKKFVEAIVKYDESRTRTDSLYLTCLFKGVDDKAVNTAAAGLNAAQSFLMTIDDAGMDTCLKIGGNVASFFENAATQAGESFGKMAVACTEKGQKIVNDQKMSNDEKVSQITQLITNYLK